MVENQQARTALQNVDQECQAKARKDRDIGHLPCQGATGYVSVTEASLLSSMPMCGRTNQVTSQAESHDTRVQESRQTAYIEDPISGYVSNVI